MSAASSLMSLQAHLPTCRPFSAMSEFPSFSVRLPLGQRANSRKENSVQSDPGSMSNFPRRAALCIMRVRRNGLENT